MNKRLTDEERSSVPLDGLVDGALNEAIDRMISVDQTSPATHLIEKVHSLCAEVSITDLRVAIEVHRANCHQPRCPVLAAMEEHAATRSVGEL